MKKVILLFVLVVAVLVPTMIHAQGLVEYPAIFTLCTDFSLVPGPLPTGQVPGGGANAHWVTEGNYINIIVDGDCYISPGAIVNGMVFEPDNTGWSIFVDPQAKVFGDIEEKGPGDVRMTVGHGQRYNGRVKEEGPGDVHVWVDGMFSGKVEEMNDGWLRIDVFGGPDEGGPGTYTGIAEEKDAGDAYLFINESGGLSGEYIGKFKEEGPGECSTSIDHLAQPPIGNVCGT